MAENKMVCGRRHIKPLRRADEHTIDALTLKYDELYKIHDIDEFDLLLAATTLILSQKGMYLSEQEIERLRKKIIEERIMEAQPPNKESKKIEESEELDVKLSDIVKNVRRAKTKKASDNEIYLDIDLD